MSIAYLESKLNTLEKFKFFTDLMERFSDSKKQMNLIKRIIFLEFDSIESDSFRLEENDNRSVEYYVSEIRDIVTRFSKAKKVDEYNRARELLKRCSLEIAEAIRSTKDAVADEKEKAEILAELPEKGVSIQRSKGLGENQPDMMWQTTMNPETRRLIKVTSEDPEKMAATFDLLLGDNLQGRKEFIAENGKLYIDMTDVS